jgi:hypothetical protein
MPTPQPYADSAQHRLRTAVVVRVDEQACQVWDDGQLRWVEFAPMFPTPRLERVSPGHLVAVATAPSGTGVVVWRWYDAVVLEEHGDGLVRLWEPGHGEVFAQARASYVKQDPGSRAYASAGLPGAEWWVAGTATGAPHTADVELDDVEALYTENGLWSTVFDLNT